MSVCWIVGLYEIEGIRASRDWHAIVIESFARFVPIGLMIGLDSRERERERDTLG